MKRIIAIGGEPLTGKSTLVLWVMNELMNPNGTCFTYGLLKGYVSHERRLVVLGRYKREEGPLGTDALSKNVLSDALDFLESFDRSFQHADQMTVLFEGSRMFNGSFLRACRDRCPDTRLVVLKTTREILEPRRFAQKISQNELRRVRSTLYSVVATLGARHFMSDNEEDMERNVRTLIKMLE